MKTLVTSLLAFGLSTTPLAAQDLRDILSRLDRLEQENRTLREEVRQLRERIEPPPAAAAPTAGERLDILERRVEEQAQTKVESAQKSPLRLHGMAVANAFTNSQFNGGSDNPAIASAARGNAGGGATFRQSVFGLEYDGGRSVLGGAVHGSIFVDFFGGGSSPLASSMRIRTASVGIDWASRSLTVGQEKPIISPRDPDSLAQIGVSPLTGAGNLWLWLPQVKFEQRVAFSPSTRLALQGGVMQTSEGSANVPAAFSGTLERYRPGYEGRVELSHAGQFEIAAGGHHSVTHVAGASVDSNVFSLDWKIAPVERLALTGAFFRGTNVAHFGTGGIRQGFTIVAAGDVRPVHTKGGWAQLRIKATERLRFHLMSGIHDDRDSDLGGAGIGRNHAWGGNFFYSISPNVIVSLEAMQTRTRHLGIGLRRNNHYDLSIAYLF